MPEVRDFEDDKDSSLDRYSPGGVETIIRSTSNSYSPCDICDEHCAKLGNNKNQLCWGEVKRSELDEGKHLCAGHDVKRFANWSGTYEEDDEADKLNKRGADNNWYKSEPIKKEG